MTLNTEFYIFSSSLVIACDYNILENSMFVTITRFRCAIYLCKAGPSSLKWKSICSLYTNCICIKIIWLSRDINNMYLVWVCFNFIALPRWFGILLLNSKSSQILVIIWTMQQKVTNYFYSKYPVHWNVKQVHPDNARVQLMLLHGHKSRVKQ